MIETQNFLFEIGTEELPAKNLKNILTAFTNAMSSELLYAQLSFQSIQGFATPRRLAVMIQQLALAQPAHEIERKGPALAAAFDSAGNPSKATEGFARSCNVSVADLQKKETPQGSWLIHRYVEAGKSTQALLPEMIKKIVSTLPFPKTMRWGNSEYAFIRPVHWLLMMHGTHVIDAELFGKKTGHETHGHRFHRPFAITIKNAADYTKTLHQDGMVIADFDERRKLIQTQITKMAAEKNGHGVIDEKLLDEVTGLVEWPVALCGQFSECFLTLPEEVVILTLQVHQKCFAIRNADFKLLPYFITISNIESKDTERVVKGNERVVHARLSDAEFFYHTDKKQKLMDRLEKLKHVVYQEKLGSLYDKSERIVNLAQAMAESLNVNLEQAKRAALLCKTDLVTNMVGEFPELQGVMGYYYALSDGESREIAMALREHYLPRYAGDELPLTPLGCVIALADRLDTLVSYFAIDKIPTGDKDPFGLRRAALSLLRIIIEKQISCDLQALLQKAFQGLQLPNKNEQSVEKTFDFIMERLRSWYQEQGISADVFAAVLARRPTSPMHFDRRIKAVTEFRKLPQAQALATANKRVSNLLLKEGQEDIAGDIAIELLIAPEEQVLHREVVKQLERIKPHLKEGNYTPALMALAELQPAVDHFFDTVMVMVDDEKLRDNRLRLLSSLRNLFLNIADISVLQL